MARSALTTIAVLCGLALIPSLQPPAVAGEDGRPRLGHWQATALAVALLLVYGAVLAVGRLRTLWELTFLPIWGYVMLVLVIIGWAEVLRLVWHVRLYERLRSLRRPHGATSRRPA